jgi:hypothetical protein
MRKAAALASLVLLLCASVGAQAFGLGGAPSARIFAEFKPVVGAWAEYVVTVKGEKPVTMRLAVVAKEGEAFWYEVVMPMGEDGDWSRRCSSRAIRRTPRACSAWS